ncbi:MAG: hypothetical protein E7268_04420 [Lachnospiraceae bacterium]|nr:hypothetical protein [Lachnospiraceae bacterium]
MEKDLKLEVYASKTKVMPVSLHVYKLVSQNITDSRFKVIRGASWKIRNLNQCGVFENGEVIFTTEEIETEIPKADFKLEYLGLKQPDVQENKRVYEALVKYYIERNLEKILVADKYRKYSCKSEITSKFIMTERGFNIVTSGNKEISLERKYKVWVSIEEDGYAYLRLDTSSVFSSNLTLADYISKGKNVLGMEVKNDWSKNKQSGTVVEVSDTTVTDPLDFAPSLKAYYEGRGEGYRVAAFPDDTPVVRVRLNEKNVIPYYPQALKPILSREVVGRMDADFSLKIERYVKRDMRSRLELDRDFINDIGELSEMYGLAFETECCPVERIGFLRGVVEMPKLVCGDSKTIDCGKEYQVFNHGFYKKTEKQIKIGYLYPVGTKPLMKAIVNAIYGFSVKGQFHGEKDKYICNGLLDIQVAPMIQEEYELGDITAYKRAAHKIRKVEDIDIVIAMVPDGMEEDSPYNPFKTIWAEANIPSQMISVSTARLFANETDSNSSRYFLHNIVLGILGKTGGIPWIVKDMPGNADCFVGLDVATVDAGIHFPACSVLFDKYGKLIGFYKPKQAQKGEKITTKILQDIFDQVLFSYEDEYGEPPKSIVIHRDGFSNENDDWYEKYFSLKGIAYTIVEVRKNISSKIVMYKDGEVTNPDIGYCVYNQSQAYLVTTDMKQKKGSPNPILIEKRCGDEKMIDVIRQILFLTQLHVGSTHKMRLPITTGYADKICKNREFVPEGKVDNKLFFL